MAILPFTGPVPDIIPQLNNLFGGVLVSVKNYGARGDGVTDDTAAIQAVLDLFNYASGHKSGIIVFPAGTYLVTGLTYQGDFGHAIWIWCPPPGQSQNGDGAVLKYNGTSGGTVLSLLGANNCIVENLSISGNAGLAKIGLLIDYDSGRSMSSFNCEVRHPVIGGCAGVDSTYIKLGTSAFASAEHKIINPWLTGHSTPGTSYYGITVAGNNCKNVSVIGGQINGFKWGIDPGNSGYFNIINTSFSSNTNGDTKSGATMSIRGCGSEGSARFVDGTLSASVANMLSIEDCYWAGICPADDYVIRFGGQLYMRGCELGNGRTGSSIPKIKNYGADGSCFISLNNTYQGLADTNIPVYDGSDRLIGTATDSIAPMPVTSMGDHSRPTGGGSITFALPWFVSAAEFQGEIKVVSTTPYDLLIRDRTILVDATTGNRTVNLDGGAARNKGKIVTVKKIDSSANTVTTTDGVSGIDGGTVVLTAQWDSVTVQGTGSGWAVIAIKLSGGTLTGSGTSGRLAFWNGSTSLSSDSELLWDDGNNRFGVGAAPTYKLDVQGTSGTVAIRAASATAGDILFYGTSLSAITGSLNLFKALIEATQDVIGTVENADTTSATARAICEVKTGGASAGDPMFKYTITGIVNWSHGLDNSDSDRWKLCASDTIGTTTVLEARPDGKVLVGALGVGNSASATTPGSVTNKIEIFDAAGTSLGFIAVYDAIT